VWSLTYHDVDGNASDTLFPHHAQHRFHSRGLLVCVHGEGGHVSDRPDGRPRHKGQTKHPTHADEHPNQQQVKVVARPFLQFPLSLVYYLTANENGLF